MATNETVDVEDSILAKMKGPSVPSHWVIYFGRIFCPCMFLSGLFLLVLHLIPTGIAFLLNYSGNLRGNVPNLLIFFVGLMGYYLGLMCCLAGSVVHWREPWGRSTYRITSGGIVWEVDGEERVVISWEEVRSALFFVPSAGRSEINKYYQGFRKYLALFFSPCTRSDRQNFLNSFDPNKRGSFSYPPYHFMLFLHNGELRLYLAPPPTRSLCTEFARFLFLFDFRVFDGYVSSIHGEYIAFGSLFFEKSELYLLGSRERASVLGKRRRERRRFLLALTHGLIRNGFKLTFK